MMKLWNFIVVCLWFVCVQCLVSESSVHYHTMLYVKILNYTAPSSGPFATKQPDPNTATVTCCRSVPLVNCSHFCETVFSVCVDRCNNTVNITYTYRNNFLGENYGVIKLNQQHVENKTLLIKIYEKQTNIRTGHQSTRVVDTIKAVTPSNIKPYLWSSVLENNTLSNYTTISLGTQLFCESNWYPPTGGCTVFKSVDQLHMITTGGGGSSSIPVPSIACTYKGKETAKIEIITTEPYKYTRDVLMSQIAAFVADKICSSATHSMTLEIVDVRYDKPILRVVFWSECVGGGLASDNYLEFSDMKVFQALLYMTPFEERKYFSDPVKRKDLSNTKSQGNFKILFRLKSYVNAKHIVYTKGPIEYDGPFRCPVHGCTPAFKITYDSDSSFISDDNLFGDELKDCFGYLVNPGNASSTPVLNTIVLSRDTNWNEAITLTINIYHLNITSNVVGLLNISLASITTVGSSFQRARPQLITKTMQTGVSVELEVMVWCSNGRTGDNCQNTCIPGARTDCNVGICLPQGKKNDGPSANFHCRDSGQCVNGTCVCSGGKSGIMCGINNSAYLNPVVLQGTGNIENVIGNSTECTSGYIGYNCDRVDYCYSKPCVNGTCTNIGGWYSCNCTVGYMGYNCDHRMLLYCNPNPCLNGGSCTSGVDHYTCTCPEGYSGKDCDVKVTEGYHNLLYVRILDYTAPSSSISAPLDSTTNVPLGGHSKDTGAVETCCWKLPFENCTHFCRAVFTICMDECKHEINITYTHNEILEENYNYLQLNIRESPGNLTINVRETKTDIITGRQTSSVSTTSVSAGSFENNFWTDNIVKDITFTNGARARCYIKLFCETNWFNPGAGCNMTMPEDELQYNRFMTHSTSLTQNMACVSKGASKIVIKTQEPYKYTKEILASQLADFIADKVCSTNTESVHIYLADVRYTRPYLHVFLSGRFTEIKQIDYVEFSDLKFTQALMFMSSFEEREYFTDPVIRTDNSRTEVGGQVYILIRVTKYSNPMHAYYTQNDGTDNIRESCPDNGCLPVFQFDYDGKTQTLPVRRNPADDLHACFGYLIYDKDTTDKTNNTIIIDSEWPPTHSMSLTIYSNVSKTATIASLTVDLNSFNEVGHRHDQALSKIMDIHDNVTNVSVQLEMMVWCAHGFTGKTCVHSCEMGNCTISDCSEISTDETRSKCKNGGKCESGKCTCSGRWSGQKCNIEIDQTQTFYSKLNMHFLNTSDCDQGYTGYNCNKENTCDQKPCVHGQCEKRIYGYECKCEKGFHGYSCEYDDHNCKDNWCWNGGRCNNGFCNCTAGYNGSRCENDIDDCYINLCQNSGTCIDSVNNYTCNCTAGFEGLNCETNINDCDDNLCRNNGTCIDGVNNYTCNCTEGFDGLNCETNINDCDDNLCRNNGMCIDGVNNYTCNCTEGFDGLNCETNINDCDDNLCRNNGMCIDGVNNYTCNCTEGFEGLNCETNINDCDDNLCRNNGMCIDGVNNYTCNCTEGFDGLNCEININDCDASLCKNNGTCIDGVNNYTCNCTEGFEGLNCEININECDDSLCKNNGTCIDGVNNYTCNCTEGFEGWNCETDINDCDHTLCLNNGTCIDGVNNYTCNCTVGFEGWNCDTNINECDDSLCKNNGTCIDGVNNYTCNCTDGFEGWNCDTNINECDDSLCKNNGTCIDGVNNYTCNCTDGFEGRNCEIDINDCVPNVCKNNGTCIDGVNNYSCKCTEGFEGRDCEISNNDCVPNLCKNNGTCVDGVNNYTCKCTDGTEGRNCETTSNTSYCESNPCLNNGSCKDTWAGYSCQCPYDFVGVRCEMENDVCKMEPCLNNGTCVFENGTRICNCLHEYVGKNCSEMRRVCHTVSCLNGATCSILDNNIFCQCSKEFTGKYCENDINECDNRRVCDEKMGCRNILGGFICVETYMLDLSQDVLSVDGERDKLLSYLTSLVTSASSASIPVCRNIDWRFHEFDISQTNTNIVVSALCDGVPLTKQQLSDVLGDHLEEISNILHNKQDKKSWVEENWIIMIGIGIGGGFILISLVISAFILYCPSNNRSDIRNATDVSRRYGPPNTRNTRMYDSLHDSRRQRATRGDNSGEHRSQHTAEYINPLFRHKRPHKGDIYPRK